MPRRFPPPWTVHQSEGAFWVEDANGARFGYCYYRDPLPVGVHGPAVLARDEARRIATNIAKLPELLKGSD